MAAHKNFKSFNVELLVQLCKELRNRHGDEVTYDGASALASTACGWPATRRVAVQLSATCILVLAGTPYVEQLGDRNTRKLVAAFDEAIASSAFLALPRTKE